MEMNEHAAAFAAKIDLLTPELRTHLRMTIEMLVEVYLDSDAHAVLVLSRDTTPMGELLTINCNEMKAFELVDQVHTILEAVNTDGAPAKEMMN